MLLQRQKSRILFMTRDTNEGVILHIIDLLDLMKGTISLPIFDIPENGMISSEEDELVFELILDVAQAIGHRAYQYFAKWSLAQETDPFISILQFLKQYAKDEEEINHVYVFVLNAAGNVDDVLEKPYSHVFDLNVMEQALTQQRKEWKLTARSLQLLAALLKACLRVVRDGAANGLEKRRALYEQMCGLMEGLIIQLLSIYRTEAAVLRLLVEAVGFIQFSSVEIASAVAAKLVELFESETDLDMANHILNITSHIVAQCTHAETLDLTSLLQEASMRSVDQWTEVNTKYGLKLLNKEEEGEKEEAAQKMCVALGRVVNLYCYVDCTKTLEDKQVMSTVLILLSDISETTESM